MLDSMVCTACGVTGCVSWSATEGGRCHAHSTYIGPAAVAGQAAADAARAARRAARRGDDAEFAGAELDAALLHLRAMR